MASNHNIVTLIHLFKQNRSWNHSNVLTDTGIVDMGNGTIVNDVLSIISESTPGFDKLNRRTLPLHPYTKTWDYSYTVGALAIGHWYQDSDPVVRGEDTYWMNADAFGCNFRTWNVNGKLLEAEEAGPKALSQLFSNLSLQKASSGVFLAEAGKTAAHLAHTATRLYKAISALKKARFGDFMDALGMTHTPGQLKSFNKSAKSNFGVPGKGFTYDPGSKSSRETQRTKFSDFMASSWLEYTYGWKPLLQDVYQHSEALAQIGIETSGAVRVARGKAKTSFKTFWSDPIHDFYYEHGITSNKFAEYVVEYKVPPSSMDFANIFGLTNPASIAWELVPFSFVADWFLPIGTALEQITSTVGLVFHRGTFSARHVLNRHSVGKTGILKQGGRTFIGDVLQNQGVYQHVGIIRQVLFDFPSVQWPTFKDPRSISHGLSAISLLQTLFLRK